MGVGALIRDRIETPAIVCLVCVVLGLGLVTYRESEVVRVLLGQV